MKHQVLLEKAEDEIWPNGFSLEKIKAPDKVLSILEVIGIEKDQLVTFSHRCRYLAVCGNSSKNLNSLYIIDLTNGKYFLLKKLSNCVITMEFHKEYEHLLFISTSNCDVYQINIDSGETTVMVGHQCKVLGIDFNFGLHFKYIMTHSCKEVLLWAWPSLELDSRMKVDPGAKVVWAGVAGQRKELLVGFECGNVIIWEDHNRRNQLAIKAPEGVNMKFTSFALLSNCEWLVGGGTSSLLVTYSLINRRVAQVLQLPDSCTDVSRVYFLPSVVPKYLQTLLLLSSDGTVNIVDFLTLTKIKSLSSRQQNIVSINVSRDGYLVAITYSNSVTKLYTLSSFFPKVSTAAKQSEKVVSFNLVKENEANKKEKVTKTKKEQRKKAAREAKELLDRKKWYPILRDFGEYPSKYRIALWTSLLGLPRNYSAVGALLKKGIHPAYENLHFNAAGSKVIFKALQKVLSCLAYWSPFLTKVPFLSDLVFPFVKLFHNNLVLCFEISSTIILNWGRTWFEFWPKPSVTTLNFAEHLLCDYAPDLLTHFIKLKVTSEDYAWDILTSLFSVVLPKNDWLILWDHVVSNPPTFLTCAIISLLICAKPTLLSCTSSKDVFNFLCQETWVSIKSLIAEAYKIHDNLNFEELPYKDLFSFKPIPKGGLPVFDIGPEDSTLELEQLSIKNLAPIKTYRCEEIYQQTPQNSEIVKKEDDCIEAILKMRKKHLGI